MNLIILTPTFNHPNHLKELYESLKMQDDKDFIWVIVNDGSEKDTEITITNFILENEIVIKYLYQNNAGKGAAVNYGLNNIKDSDFVLICDDDEYLNSDAVSIIKQYYNSYKDKCACICFSRSDKTGKPLTNCRINCDELMSFQKRVSLNRYSDGYLGYYVKELCNTRFPLFRGETYIGPSVLIMLVCNKSTMLWADAVIGKTEYLEGGITKRGRKLRMKNPKGMIYRAMLMMHPDSNLKVKFAYSIHAYAYKFIAKLSKEELRHDNIEMNVFFPVSAIGWILAKRWEKKYGKL